jgi:Domain of unknown function (DUF6316)
MSDKRKGEEEQTLRFRSERFIHNEEKWYYETREGTTEGPFRTRPEAEEHLRNYIKLINSGWWNDGADDLTLEPVKTEPEQAGADDPGARVWATPTRKGH